MQGKKAIRSYLDLHREGRLSRCLDNQNIDKYEKTSKNN